MATPTVKALTYRVRNIPFGTTHDQLIKDYFNREDQDDITVRSLCPAVENPQGPEHTTSRRLTATVVFRPREPKPAGPRVHSTIIQVDRDFTDFTPLYVPPPEKGPISADIIAVTGLAGHAYGSWAYRDDEEMWLRDCLPDHIPNARIMTYGYASHLHLVENQSFTGLSSYATDFGRELVRIRQAEGCQSRPIIFIGHSLGGLIIKKAFLDTRPSPLGSDSHFRLPVRAIVFIATPHRGLDVRALRTLVRGQPSQTLVDELHRTSQTLQDLHERFAHILPTQDIQFLTFYETMETRTVVQSENGSWSRNGPAVRMVEKDSAILFSEEAIGVHADHSQIAKITRGQSSILGHIIDTIRNALPGAPLYNAARVGNMGRLKELVEPGRVDLDAESEPPKGFNAVSAAAFGGHIEAIRYLLGKGASGVPPSALEGKWKYQRFADGVKEETKREILKLLRTAKHKSSGK